MGKPLNMNPEDWARHIIEEQQKKIAELEASQGSNTVTDRYEYSFSANTLEPPGSGQMRMDATASLATKIWIHKLTSLGVDIINAFSNYRAGDRAYAQDKNESSSYARYVLAADPVFKTDYVELPVTMLEASASLNGGQPALLVMTRAAPT